MQNSNHALTTGAAGMALLLASAPLAPALDLSIAPDVVSPVLAWTNVNGQAYYVESAADPASAWKPRVIRDLDDSIAHWLPELDQAHINPAITVRQLLNHRAGTYNFGDDVPFRQALFSDWDRVWQPEEVLDYVRAPYFPAGTDGRYSNTGYLLAGMILREASATDLPAEMRRRIFGPAGMRSSFSGVEEGWTGNLAHPHLDFNGDGVHEDLGADTQTAILSSFWTSGHVISTAADLARFGQALFDGTLLSAASLAAMTDFRPVDIGGSDYFYGLGLMQVMIDEVEYFAHSGGLFGEYSWFSYWPSTGVSLAIAYNYPQTTSSGPAFPLAMIHALAALHPGSAPDASLRRDPASEFPWPERMVGPPRGLSLPASDSTP